MLSLDPEKERIRRQKISAFQAGKPKSKEHKDKISASNIGKHGAPRNPCKKETKAKISTALTGKPLSANHKANLSSSHIGVLLSEEHKASIATHGLSYTPEYTTWYSMLCRCYNLKNIAYKNYGGRGITVCERWKPDWKWVGGSLSVTEAVRNFLVDMGSKPSPELSLDRINNDGNYEPGNCKWATIVEQRNNRRKYKRQQYSDEAMEALKATAELVCVRIFQVYRPEYIDKCVREEPDILLALTKRLETAVRKLKE